MLELRQSLINRPVLSLRTGGKIAQATEIIVNPANLKIEGWHCQDRFSRKKAVVLSSEVRDIISKGIVVNDHDALSDPDDLVRLKDILNLKFSVLGKIVVTTGGQRLGKVSDFAVESTSLMIQKLYVSQSLFKSLGGGSLSIDRSQIVEITNRKIVVNEPTVTDEAPATAPVIA